MAAYRRVYDSRRLQTDCQEPGSAPEPYARLSSMGYLLLAAQQTRCQTLSRSWHALFASFSRVNRRLPQTETLQSVYASPTATRPAVSADKGRTLNNERS